MIVHFSAHISKWELVCKFGMIFHISIISCLCSRFHVWNQWFFYSVITFSYTKCFVHSYTVDVVFTLSYYSDVIMSPMAYQIARVPIVCSIVCSAADQRKYQNSASLAFVRGIRPHKGPVTRKLFPFDDVIMDCFISHENVRNIWSLLWNSIVAHSLLLNCKWNIMLWESTNISLITHQNYRFA